MTGMKASRLTIILDDTLGYMALLACRLETLSEAE